MSQTTADAPPERPPVRARRRWRLGSAWVLACVMAVGSLLWPIASVSSRLMLLVSLAGVWLAALVLIGRVRRARAVFLVLTLLAAVWLCLPGRRADPTRLRAEYIQGLRAYEGTFYVWGGENRLGIDCSGLIRRALVDANLRLGLRTLNPALVRHGLWLWWHDASAQRLGEGFGGLARPLGHAPSLNSDAAAAGPGDFAVTDGGVHTLACVADHTWIEADPGEGGVVVVRTPSPNPWFGHPVTLLRWRALE